MVIILFKGSGAGIKTYTIKRIYVGLAFLLDALELKSYTERLIGRKTNSSQIQRLIVWLSDRSHYNVGYDSNMYNAGK